MYISRSDLAKNGKNSRLRMGGGGGLVRERKEGRE
jgi:hypothetical protein